MGVKVVAWNRFGHRRSYVNDDDGTSLGYRDEATGEVHVVVAARAAEVHHALATQQPERTPADEERARRRAAALGQARAQRSWAKPTLSEKALADELTRSSPFAWVREVAWGAYRPDFYCAVARLVVEVDGSSHRRRGERDAERDAYFRSLGVETLRVTAEEVERDCAAVVARINRACITRVGTSPQRDQRPRGLVGRLLGRATAPAPPPLAPATYDGLRKGRAFVCARCRAERSPAQRSVREAGCCTECVP